MRSLYAALYAALVLSTQVGCGATDSASSPAAENEGALGAQSTRQLVTIRVASGTPAVRIFDKVLQRNQDLLETREGFEQITIDGHTLACNDTTARNTICLLTFESNRDPSEGSSFTLLVGDDHDTARVFANSLFMGLGETATGGVRCDGEANRMPLKASCSIEGTVTEVRRAGTRFGGRYQIQNQ